MNPRRRLYNRIRSAPAGGRQKSGASAGLENMSMQVSTASRLGGTASSNGHAKSCPLSSRHKLATTTITSNSCTSITTATNDIDSQSPLHRPTSAAPVASSQCNCQSVATHDTTSQACNTAAAPPHAAAGSPTGNSTHLTKQNLELENTVLCYTDEAMKGPMYSTPPVQSKTSTATLSFICENPDVHIGPKPAIPNPRDSSVQCGTQVQLNYFNISASSVSLKCRPPSARTANVLKQSTSGIVLGGSAATGPKFLRPRTAPARRKPGHAGPISPVKSSTSISSASRQQQLGAMDIQRAPLVPTLVSFDAHGPAQCWNVAPKKVQPATVRHKHVYSQWRSPSSFADTNRTAAQLKRSTPDTTSSSQRPRQRSNEPAPHQAAPGQSNPQRPRSARSPKQSAASTRPRLQSANPMTAQAKRSKQARADPLSITSSFSNALASANSSASLAEHSPAVTGSVTHLSRSTSRKVTSKTPKTPAFTYSLNTRSATMTNRAKQTATGLTIRSATTVTSRSMDAPKTIVNIRARSAMRSKTSTRQKSANGTKT